MKEIHNILIIYDYNWPIPENLRLMLIIMYKNKFFFLVFKKLLRFYKIRNVLFFL